MLLSRRMTLLDQALSGNSVRILPYPLSQFALTLMAPILISSCGGDECDHGEVQCDGNVARNCVFAEPRLVWQSNDCGNKSCVVISQNATRSASAFCALSASPDPRCSEPDVPNCASEGLLECKAGYAISTQACTSGCLTLDGYPDRCVGDTAPDSMRCNADGYVCAMAGQLLYDETSISSGGPFSGGVCSVSSMPTAAGYSVYSQRCEGGSIVARTRCAQSCELRADCTTGCL